MNLTKSFEYLEQSRKTIPGLTQTFSRAAPSFVEGVYPVFAKSGFGSHFTDVDENIFLDYLMGLGPITLGYNYPSVNEAITNQLKNGILFSLPHISELKLTEVLCKIIPNAEMVKFEKSGSNAVTGAVRAARALTKKDKIAYCGSAGVWHDWQAIMISRNLGVPEFNKELIRVFDYNDAEGLEKIFEDNKNEIAAVVIEPTHFDEPKNDFLKKVRKLATSNNAILILDEIVTGFRFDLQGGQKYFGIDGDLICFGKGMANGLPLSAITGKTEFMKIFEELWVSSTNNSETLSLVGSMATISEMQSKSTIQHCWEIGKKLKNGWNKIAEEKNIQAKMVGYPIRMTMQCFDSNNVESETLKALILQEMVKRNIFISPGPSFISFSHTTQDIDSTLEKFIEVCDYIQSNLKDGNYLSLLEGNLPQTIWHMIMKPIKKS